MTPDYAALAQRLRDEAIEKVMARATASSGQAVFVDPAILADILQPLAAASSLDRLAAEELVSRAMEGDK